MRVHEVCTVQTKIYSVNQWEYIKCVQYKLKFTQLTNESTSKERGKEFDCDVFEPLGNKIQYKNNKKPTVDFEFNTLITQTLSPHPYFYISLQLTLQYTESPYFSRNNVIYANFKKCWSFSKSLSFFQL